MFHQIDQTTAVSVARGTGRWVLQKLNTHYGYWATRKFLTDSETEAMLALPAYEGPVHPAEKAHQHALAHSCG